MAELQQAVDNNIEEPDLNSEEIDKKLVELFGEDIAKAFADQDINCLLAVEDLLERDADSPIFSKLGMTYGKVIKFKREFEKLVPKKRGEKYKATPQPRTKPSMGDLANFSPELRRLYLCKRKRVGVLASEHWQHKCPKFNTPEKKSELKQFAGQISDECSLPEARFYTDGIEEHIKQFFSEQRRFLKNKTKYAVPSSPSGSSSSELDTSPPKLPSMMLKANSTVDDDDDDDNEVTTGKPLSGSEANGTRSPFASLPNRGLVSFQDIDVQDDDGNSSASGDTLILTDTEKEEEIHEPSMTKKSAAYLVKSVTGKVLEREGIVTLLKGKFSVPVRSLTDLTPTQLMQVFARKLVTCKYVSIKPGVTGDFKRGDFTVLKEISIC